MRPIDADKLLEEYGKQDIEFAVNAQDTLDVIVIPNGATNGDMIMAMFPYLTVYVIDAENDCITICIDDIFYQKFRYSWWNAPYEREVDE